MYPKSIQVSKKKICCCFVVLTRHHGSRTGERCLQVSISHTMFKCPPESATANPSSQPTMSSKATCLYTDEYFFVNQKIYFLTTSCSNVTSRRVIDSHSSARRILSPRGGISHPLSDLGPCERHLCTHHFEITNILYERGERNMLSLKMLHHHDQVGNHLVKHSSGARPLWRVN